MQLKSLFLGLLLTGPLALGSIAGCSSDDSGTSSVAEADLSSRIADAICGAGRKCSCEVPASCEAEFTRLGSRPPGAEGLSYDAECAGKVVAYYESLSDCQGYRETSQCCRVYYGAKRAGEACVDTSGVDDCGQGLRCIAGTCAAMCSDSGKAQLGQSCESVGCVDGLWCDYYSSETAVCAPLPGAGESCYDSFECQAGLKCVQLGSDDVCVVPGALGAACEPYTCAKGLGCVDGVCAAKKPAGSLCSEDDECEGVCDEVCRNETPAACGFFY